MPTGFQRAPFFDVQTNEFALIAIDTGVVRGVDPVQWRWLEATLDQARGKAIMAVVGHPFYAGGAYVAEGERAVHAHPRPPEATMACRLSWPATRTTSSTTPRTIPANPGPPSCTTS